MNATAISIRGRSVVGCRAPAAYPAVPDSGAAGALYSQRVLSTSPFSAWPCREAAGMSVAPSLLSFFYDCRAPGEAGGAETSQPVLVLTKG